MRSLLPLCALRFSLTWRAAALTLQPPYQPILFYTVAGAVRLRYAKRKMSYPFNWNAIAAEWLITVSGVPPADIWNCNESIILWRLDADTSSPVVNDAHFTCPELIKVIFLGFACRQPPTATAWLEILYIVLNLLCAEPFYSVLVQTQTNLLSSVLRKFV